jgi:hypothetical protein
MRRSFLAAGLILTVLTPSAQAGADAAPDAAPPTESVTVTGHALLDNPDGKGDPDTITCRKPQQLPGSRFMAPPVCKTNGEWAQIRKNGNDVSPDGRSITASEKARTLNPAVCMGSSPPTANNVFSHDSNPTCTRY